jgi:hypothetical protein
MSELRLFVNAHTEQAAELLAVVSCQFGLLLATAQLEIAATTQLQLADEGGTRSALRR